MIHLIGHTKNKIPVYVDLVESAVAKHIARQPHLLSLAAEALPNITLKTPVVRLEHDMGRTIGYDFVVETEGDDPVFYVQLVHDHVYTRFTKNSKPAATSCIAMSFERNQKDASYNLRDIGIGHLTPPRPGSPQETSESRPYWEKHAIVFENQPIQPRSLTKVCPY